jgi:ribosomal protein L21E
MSSTALDLTPPSKASKAPKEPKVPKVSRFAALYPRDAKVTVLVPSNPKRGASKERFDGYTGSETVGAALDKGVTYADLAWDVGHGLVRVG